MKILLKPGFSLLELMIAIAVVGSLTALSVPTFLSVIERNHLKLVLESFKADLLVARIEAIKRSQNVAVSRQAGNLGAWCYGINAGNTCDCKLEACSIRTVSGVDFSSKVSMRASAVNHSFFDFRRGTIAANGVTFNTQHYEARVVFSDTGRVRICTPVAALLSLGKMGLPDIPSC
ncbi:MAG: GspH/FimT family pseudopilin [Methylococcaceae bacterium]|jgi:prepilin-type N-terminal cleavage/methylation domain-containing protein